MYHLTLTIVVLEVALLLRPLYKYHMMMTMMMMMMMMTHTPWR